jgi:hypothetical protein
MATANAINADSSGLVRYDGAGTFTGVTTTNHNILVGAASNGITNIALTNGQLAIGSTGADPVAATITAGTGITTSTGAGSFTINAVGGGLTWTVVTGTTQAAAVNNAYIANNAGLVTVTLPATSAVGDTVIVTGINNATGWKVAQNAGNTIFFGTSTTTAGTGGSLASTNTRDTVWMVCMTANATWNVVNSIGNITVV